MVLGHLLLPLSCVTVHIPNGDAQHRELQMEMLIRLQYLWQLS